MVPSNQRHHNNHTTSNVNQYHHHPHHSERRITTGSIMIGRCTFMSFIALMIPLLVLNHHNYGVVTAFSISLPRTSTKTTTSTTIRRSTQSDNAIIEQSPLFGNSHGTNSCFLPLQQLEQDTYMPRIIHIVNGIYPSNDMTMEDIRRTPPSEYSPALGQWTYTFHTPTSSSSNNNNGDVPVQATIALEGSNIVASCEDPIVVIAEHTALNIVLPAEITQPVDLLVLIDRSKTYFSERKFLLFALLDNEQQQQQVHIAAFHTRDEIPSNAIVLGQVEQVTIPWLPSMAPTKTGFLEADEYY